jgi:hypothetical protein
MPEPDGLTLKANAVAMEANADVLVYTGSIERPFDDEVIDSSLRRRRRENVLLFITTYGGDADAAYRIARCLRSRYKKVTAVVPGFCKSAGTLLVLGADELVMFDHAELGPLDVQLWKQDELGERSSGLTPTQAFLSLDAQVREALQDMMVKLKLELLLTTKTASELASRVVSSLYGGVYSQFDPLRLGEIQRAQAVALQYGKRLIAQSQITDINSLSRLVSGYPSHAFVIDLMEAKQLFGDKVREPTLAERALEDQYHGRARTPVDSGRAITMFLNEEVRRDESEKTALDADVASAAAPDGPGAAANSSGAAS